ncbi:MAG: hypothetical protein ACK4GR_06140, partial [bacterium]
MKNNLLYIFFCTILFSCTSTTNNVMQTNPDKTDKVIEKDNFQGLPDEIKTYKSWLKMNKSPIPPDTSAPHTPSNGNKNVFVNQ